jgi:hypothetical protein
MKNKGIICYDVLLVPHFLMAEEVFKIAKETGYLFYNSFEAIKMKSPKPYPYMLEGDMDKILVDVSTKEGKEIYDKLLNLEENEKE